MDYAGLISKLNLEEKCSLLSGGPQFDTKAFRFFDVSAGNWAVEAGEYQTLVGASSVQLPLVDTVTVKGVSGGGMV